MADSLLRPGSNGVESSRAEGPPPRPRWVYVFGLIVILLVVLVVILHITGHRPTH